MIAPESAAVGDYLTSNCPESAVHSHISQTAYLINSCLLLKFTGVVEYNVIHTAVAPFLRECKLKFVIKTLQHFNFNNKKQKEYKSLNP